MTTSGSRTGRLAVGVLLGDPRLPYPYAVDGRFGEEEMAQMGHLRSALAELDGYRFTFFDDHERLIDDLRASPPELALNLCDTGYRNQWELERNVPTLLEIRLIRVGPQQHLVNTENSEDKRPY